MYGRARSLLAPGCALVLSLVALAGCGSSASSSRQVAAARRLAAERAAAARASSQQRIVAEASDLTPYSTCEEWLGASPPARESYLHENWPYLHPKQVVRVVHEQSIGCQVAPRSHARTPMDPLQASVDLVVLGLAIFYEETLAVGIKESVDHYDRRAMGLHFSPPTQPHARRLRLRAKH